MRRRRRTALTCCFDNRDPAVLVACGAPQPTATEPPATERHRRRTRQFRRRCAYLTATTLRSQPHRPPTPLGTPRHRTPADPDLAHQAGIVYHGLRSAELSGCCLFCGYDEFVSVLAWEHEDSDLKARDEWAYDVAQNRLELLATVPYVIYNLAVTDGPVGRVIAFGPENTAVYNMETRTWEKTNPAEEPPTYRFWYSMAYDSQSDRVILFGGYPQLHDTWAYDYETNTWTEMSPEVSPSNRRGHAILNPGAGRRGTVVRILGPVGQHLGHPPPIQVAGFNQGGDDNRQRGL